MTYSLKQIYGMIKDHDPKVRQWFAKLIAGVLVADDVISEEEKGYLVELTEISKSEPEIRDTVAKIVMSMKVPDLEPIDVDSETAGAMIQCLLNICACDQEFHYKEIRFIKQAGVLLNVSPIKLYEFIDHTVIRVKSESFEKIIESMNTEERYWFAVMILKVIFADDKVRMEEFLYFSDIYDLATEADALMNLMKNEDAELELKNLPKVSFDEEQTERILRYLLHVSMTDKQFHTAEYELLKDAAEHLNYSVKKFEKLAQSVQKVVGLTVY